MSLPRNNPRFPRDIDPTKVPFPHHSININLDVTRNGDTTLSARILATWSCFRRPPSLLPQFRRTSSPLRLEGWVCDRLGTQRKGEGMGCQDEGRRTREAFRQLRGNDTVARRRWVDVMN